tara:strand:- start:2310 stop:2522 length:213 start_codon:yes stop_codon:yes gene_type:complete
MPAAIGKITNLKVEEFNTEIDMMAIGDIHHITQLYNLWMKFCTKPTSPDVFEILEEKAQEFKDCLHQSTK